MKDLRKVAKMKNCFYMFILLASLVIFYLAGMHRKCVSVHRSANIQLSRLASKCQFGMCLPGRVFDVFREQQLPSAIIIGTRKGGTAALCEILATHPQVKKASNELHFFDDDSNFALGSNWYRSQMPKVTKEEISIEKTPSYLFVSSVPGRVHRIHPSVKLVVILRNPVDRLLSDYMQVQNMRKLAFSSKLSRTPRDMYVDLANSRLKNVTAVKVGIYVQQLERWLKYFPRSQLLVLDGDLFRKDPVPLLKSLETFLDLPPHFNGQNVYFNATKGFYCWLNDGISKCSSKGRAKPKVNESDIAIMKNFYRPYNERLFKLLGQTFNW